MTKLWTDRYVLQCIFDMYRSSYPGAKTASCSRENDPYVSIDVAAIARKLDCNPELLFGRLYYHLDRKYRYKQEDGALDALFHIQVGDKRHAVQFPYLASILAGLNQEFRRQWVPLGVSLFSLGVSLTSRIVSILKH